ncbi:MAG: hypothetical protein ACTSPB_17265 [Candidatus Thorarchaeota archaeon]
MIRYIIRIVLELLWSEWVYVGSFNIGEVKWKVGSYSTYSAGTIANCYESRWGTRHATITIVGDDGWPHWILKHKVRSMSEYQCEVKPWLRGRPHKQIPSFHQIVGRKWDFKKLLKGETPYILNDDEKA